MKNLYYELTENGYHIYDRNDPLFHVHQYEPYIPDKSKTYEENSQAQIHEFIIMDYVSAVSSGTMTLEEVPEEYKEEVTSKLPTPEVDPYQQGYDQAVLDCIEGGIL